MDNQLIFWYPYMCAHDEALILTTADTLPVHSLSVGGVDVVGPDVWFK